MPSNFTYRSLDVVMFFNLFCDNLVKQRETSYFLSVEINSKNVSSQLKCGGIKMPILAVTTMG